MISVCMPTYNGERFIKEQISSILQQIGPEDELIISDDESTDDTLTIVKQFDDKRVRIVTHSAKLSYFKFNLTSKNIENALQYATGEYIFLADQDDIWIDGKVEEILKELRYFDLVIHDCEVVDENGKVLHQSYFDIIGAKQGIVKNLIKNSYLGCCMAFRRSLIKKIMPLPHAEVPHDIWIGLLAEYYGKVRFHKTPLLKYRRHSANLSFSAEKSNNSFAYRLRYRKILVQQFIKRILMNTRI